MVLDLSVRVYPQWKMNINYQVTGCEGWSLSQLLWDVRYTQLMTGLETLIDKY